MDMFSFAAGVLPIITFCLVIYILWNIPTIELKLNQLRNSDKLADATRIGRLTKRIEAPELKLKHGPIIEPNAQNCGQFRVSYTIEIDAGNYEDAAVIALDILRDIGSYKPVFVITDLETGEIKEVDMEEMKVKE